MRNASEAYIRRHINIGNLSYPVKWDDLGKLETLNDVCINAYMLEKNKRSRYELIPTRRKDVESTIL